MCEQPSLQAENSHTKHSHNHAEQNIISPHYFLLVYGKAGTKTNVRFNEMRRVCCVVPGWLSPCTEVSLCCLLLPSMTLWMIIHVHRGKREESFPHDLEKQETLPTPFKDTGYFSNSLLIFLSFFAFHIITGLHGSVYYQNFLELEKLSIAQNIWLWSNFHILLTFEFSFR